MMEMSGLEPSKMRPPILGTNPFRYCQNEECDYKMFIDNVEITSGGNTEESVPA